MSPRVILVGAPGCGKSTVGALLAERLGASFRDTDADVEAAAGMTIAELFIEKGEPYFRDLEAEAVRAAIAGHEGVLSLGGGAVVREETRLALRGQRVAYLEIDLAEAARRVGLNTARPLLLGNVRGQLGQLLEQRRPLYEQVATITVSTVGRSAEAVADLIVEELPA
ncbi:shikimate kinase [Actinocrinis puniceicyclus]|uniref:Shikimate kinase n=1 Tax=Actinocrinis puniceicyclus TaxID=977794 RepID=A0A8J8BD46_9ACTN|nr:shikimate kinase [Actinocrinis puniceicyclus]MBS2963711.1 shikimate kinase [Actinocrinis puniceicyclus]